eukprot:367853-Rhodomonas_salina.4
MGYHQAAMWYLRASQQGHGYAPLAACAMGGPDLEGRACSEARICYAMALYKGEGVAQDLVQSAELFLLAASKGHKQAQYNIGVMYARGEGVEQSREEAAKVCSLCASACFRSSWYVLGACACRLSARSTDLRYGGIVRRRVI